MFKKKKKDPKEELQKQQHRIDIGDEYSEQEETLSEESSDILDQRKDKIFYNDYNVGNIDNKNLPDLKIEPGYSHTYLDSCYNSDEYEERKQLMEHIYEVFNSSQWGNLPKNNKKFPTDLRPFIFNDIYKGLDGRNYSAVEMFVAIADFMDVKYETLYDSIGIKIKEDILKELDSHYNVLSKRNVKKLF
jgi:hypothetical protein